MRCSGAGRTQMSGVVGCVVCARHAITSGLHGGGTGCDCGAFRDCLAAGSSAVLAGVVCHVETQGLSRLEVGRRRRIRRPSATECSASRLFRFCFLSSTSGGAQVTRPDSSDTPPTPTRTGSAGTGRRPTQCPVRTPPLAFSSRCGRREPGRLRPPPLLSLPTGTAGRSRGRERAWSSGFCLSSVVRDARGRQE